MRNWEVEHIIQNLPVLLESTDCHVQFIAWLEAKNVLGRADVDSLKRPQSKYEMTDKLYNILINKQNAYEPLKEALEQTNQTEALAILKSLDNSAGFHTQGDISYETCKENVLGKGMFGIVYKGTFGERPVAVKKVTAEHMFENFQQEGKILVECDYHENIVRHFASKKNSEYALIVLELCETSLYKFVRGRNFEKFPTFKLRTALDILKQTTAGIAHLHRCKVVHMDVKPQNILLNFRDDRVEVKVADFGISKRIKGTCSSFSMHTGEGAGTMEWMAPEILESFTQNKFSGKRFRKECDVFSLGCVFYFLLTEGGHPFGSPLDKLDLCWNIRKGNVAVREGLEYYVAEHGWRVVEVMEETILGMVQLEPEKRSACEDVLKCEMFMDLHQGISKPRQSQDGIESINQDSGVMEDLQDSGVDEDTLDEVKQGEEINKPVTASRDVDNESLNLQVEDAETSNQGERSISEKPEVVTTVMSFKDRIAFFESQQRKEAPVKQGWHTVPRKQRQGNPVVEVKGAGVAVHQQHIAKHLMKRRNSSVDLSREEITVEKPMPPSMPSLTLSKSFPDMSSRRDSSVLTVTFSTRDVFEAVESADLKRIHSVCTEYKKHSKVPIAEIHEEWKGVVQTPLHVGILTGDPRILEYLIQKVGFASTLGTKRMRDILHKCVGGSVRLSDCDIGNRIACLHLIIQHFADAIKLKAPNGTEDLLVTPLFTSSVHVRLLVELIVLGAECMDDNSTVLHKVVDYLSPGDFITFVKFLQTRENGESLLKQLDNENCSVLHKAVSRLRSEDPSQFLECVRYLVFTCKAELNAVNSSQHTPLVSYLLQGQGTIDFDVVEVLNTGKGKWEEVSDNCCTLLQACSSFLNPQEFHKVVHRISREKMDPVLFTSYDKQGYSVLHRVVERIDVLEETLAIFKENGVDFNSKVDSGLNFGWQFFMYAVSHRRSVECLKRLVKFGANLESATSNGYSPIHIASKYCWADTIEFLLDEVRQSRERGDGGERGGVVEYVNSVQRIEAFFTPLHYAVYSDGCEEEMRLRTVETLVKFGADVSAKDKNGRSVLALAVERGYAGAATIEFLKQKA